MATADVVSVVEGDEGPDNSASDNRHVKEISEVLADISNAANEYLLRGFDAFERCVLSTWALDDAESRAFLEGVHQVFQSLHEKLRRHLNSFQDNALRTCFYIHPSSAEQKDQDESSLHCYSEEEEERLKLELDGLVHAAKEAQRRVRTLKQEKLELQRCLSLHGDAAALEAVTQVCTMKENAAADAAALVEGALRLGPLLARAEGLERDIRTSGAQLTPLKGIENVKREVQRWQAKRGGASAEDIQAFRALLAGGAADENATLESQQALES